MTHNQRSEITTARVNATNANNLAQHLRQRIDQLDQTLASLSRVINTLDMRIDRIEKLLEENEE